MEKKRFNINLDDSAFTKERTPVKPLFQPSSKAGQSAAASSSSTTSETTAQPAPPSAGQPLSYAEFIVQSKGHAPPRVPSAPQRVGVSRVAAGTGTGIDTETGSLKQGLSQGAQGGPDVLSSSSSVGCERPQDQAQGTKDLGSGGPPGVTEGEGQRAGTEQKQGEGQGSEGSNILGHPKPVGSGNSIIVSPRQRGNPILKFVRSVPWEFGEVVPDYVLGQTTCALFLRSLCVYNTCFMEFLPCVCDVAFSVPLKAVKHAHLSPGYLDPLASCWIPHHGPGLPLSLPWSTLNPGREVYPLTLPRSDPLTPGPEVPLTPGPEVPSHPCPEVTSHPGPEADPLTPADVPSHPWPGRYLTPTLYPCPEVALSPLPGGALSPRPELLPGPWLLTPGPEGAALSHPWPERFKLELIFLNSPEEAGRYLETYKSYEKKPADLLKEHVEKDYLSKVTDCLTTVKSVNKTDSITLLSTFSSLEGIINAAKEDLVLCPGLGPQKVSRKECV
nr:DNA excision repair protein ERCC-1 [Salvelinus alpinus]